MIVIWFVKTIVINKVNDHSLAGSLSEFRGVFERELFISQGHPTSIFGKYLFGRRFEISRIFGTFVVKFLLACLS